MRRVWCCASRCTNCYFWQVTYREGEIVLVKSSQFTFIRGALFFFFWDVRDIFDTLSWSVISKQHSFLNNYVHSCSTHFRFCAKWDMNWLMCWWWIHLLLFLLMHAYLWLICFICYWSKEICFICCLYHFYHSMSFLDIDILIAWFLLLFFFY